MSGLNPFLISILLYLYRGDQTQNAKRIILSPRLVSFSCCHLHLGIELSFGVGCFSDPSNSNPQSSSIFRLPFDTLSPRCIA